MKTPPKCVCGTCKTCYQRAWRAKNPDKVKAAKAKWGRSRNRSGDPKTLEYSRKYSREHRDRVMAYLAAKHAEDPRWRQARNAINGAVRYGKVTRDPCVVCGAKRVQGHHEDYDKPLEVVWLCPKHHADRHREIDAAKKGAT
jgi:hypothetical protein